MNHYTQNGVDFLQKCHVTLPSSGENIITLRLESFEFLEYLRNRVILFYNILHVDILHLTYKGARLFAKELVHLQMNWFIYEIKVVKE